ncbi:MAG: GNAT family N-acetyltransferase [Actinobacteria bacterium]|nr:GNAT family N-acetyltransferase [Actinomycetota bacterium]
MSNEQLPPTNPEQQALPEGYAFIDKTEMQPQEIIQLRKSVGWSGDSEENWQKCIDQSGVIVGVRDKDQELVGMGRITADPRHAVLCDLVVHPGHQQKGIGTALVTERMHKAEELGIPYLYTELASDNPLRAKYKDIGFVATGDGLFRSSQ